MIKFTNWLSNKWNLIGVCTLCSVLMGTVLYEKQNFMEFVIIYTLMSVMTLCIYVLGVGKGMLLYAIQKRELDSLLKKLMKVKEDDEE